MSGHYEVIFSGEIYAAVDPVKVRTDMARMFRQPAEKVHRLFDGRTWTLKDGLDRATAERYQVELAKIGVISEIRDRQPKYETAKTTDPMSRSQNFTLEKVAITKMKCPECGYEQLEADYCARCGVSIAVARAKAKVRAKEDEVIQARIQQLRERRKGDSTGGGTGGGSEASPASATVVRRAGLVQESTMEFRGVSPNRGPSPIVWVVAMLVLLAAGFGVLVQQGIVVLNL
ncbi:MAG: TFIIB-type zinc ribbon-containing protein [Pseudomonadales bacterium]|jgi:hypothetical protein|nr:TFIIB-type zinc ribbon-containing protein [Pseudomonadales bacterium]